MDNMADIHVNLKRGFERENYKELLFDHLTEWVYPSEGK